MCLWLQAQKATCCPSRTERCVIVMKPKFVSSTPKDESWTIDIELDAVSSTSEEVSSTTAFSQKLCWPRSSFTDVEPKKAPSTSNGNFVKLCQCAFDFCCWTALSAKELWQTCSRWMSYRNLRFNRFRKWPIAEVIKLILVKAYWLTSTIKI